jgi:hypothetical protein
VNRGVAAQLEASLAQLPCDLAWLAEAQRQAVGPPILLAKGA